MDSLLDRIAERRALLSERAAQLRKELAEVEAELARACAEQLAAQSLAAAGSGDGDSEAGPGDEATAGVETGPAAVSMSGVPHRGDGAEVEDLPAEYQRLVAIVAWEQLVSAERVTARLGLSGEPLHIEAVRAKLKWLIARGWLVEPDPDGFALL